MADNHYMDELARQQLGEYEADFMEGDWSSMETMLDKRQRKRGVIWWPLGGAAAALLLWALLPNQPESVLPPLSSSEVTTEQAPAVGLDRGSDISEEEITTQTLSLNESAVTESIVDEPTAQGSVSLPSPKTLPPSQVISQVFTPALQTTANTETPDLSATTPTDGLLVAGDAEAGRSILDMDYLPSIGMGEWKETTSVETEWLLGSRNWSPSASPLQWVAGLYGHADGQQVTNRSLGGGQGLWTGAVFRQRWQVSMGMGTQTMRYNEVGSLDTVNGRVHLNTRATLQYLDIPIQIQYQLPISRRWKMYGGMGLHLWRNLLEEYKFTYQDVPAIPSSLASAIYETTLQLPGNLQEAADFLAFNQTSSSGAIPTDVSLPRRILWAASVYGGVSYSVSTRFDVGAGFRYQTPLRPLGIEQKKFRSLGLSATIGYRLR